MLKQGLLNSPESFTIPNSFYQTHRDILCENLRQNKVEANSIIIFQGIPTLPIDDKDQDYVVDQEDNFTYYFGVDEPDCFAIIEVDTNKATLFCPRIPEDYKIWMKIMNTDDYQCKYQTPTSYTDCMEERLKTLNPSTIYHYYGVNCDSGRHPRKISLSFLENYKNNFDDLYEIINEQRVIKDITEIALLQFINRISSDAHMKVMLEVKKGLKEYQMAALFRFYCAERFGAFISAYECICASGADNATLHYIVNDKILNEDSLVLNDMGVKYKGYCSDITCTFPVSGKFSQKQKQIYEAVYAANMAVQAVAKEGVRWDDMHTLAESVILQHLMALNIIHQATLSELEQKRVGAVFFPCGLGHFLGLRVHDVGGYSKGTPQRRPEAGYKCLRTRRVLKAGMFITIEPGIYFMPVNLQRAYENPEIAPYLNREVIEQYMDVGGARIEDDVLVTKENVINFTTVPRTVEEIEKFMAGEQWK